MHGNNMLYKHFPIYPMPFTQSIVLIRHQSGIETELFAGEKVGEIDLLEKGNLSLM
jgi:hypothetical protein